jgi:hypothetical protein
VGWAAKAGQTVKPNGRSGRGRILGACTLTIATVCVSCSAFDSVPNADVCAQGLVGHEARITTVQGQTLEFVVLDVTEDAVVGEFHIVPFDQIRTLERRRFDPWKAGALTAGFLAGFITATIIWFPEFLRM